MSVAAIAEVLRRDGTALNAVVLGRMYEDPFWSERYGDRGRRHADADGAFHVQYLVASLESGDPQTFVKYALWLREVLATRGMCSRHLAENLSGLAGVLTERGCEGCAHAVAVLELAVRALSSWEGPAAEIEVRRAEWATGLDEVLRREHPARFARGAAPHWTVDADLHIGYLADAVGLGDVGLFARHLAAVRAHEAAAGHAAGVVPTVAGWLAGRVHEAGAGGDVAAALAAAGEIGGA